MKKILAFILSVSMLAAFAGCSKTENVSPADEAVDTAAVTEDIAPPTNESPAQAGGEESAETEALTEAVTQAQTEDTAPSDTEAQSDADTEAASQDDAEASNLTEKLMKDIEEWDSGNVIIDISFVEEEVATEMTINTYDGKMFMHMAVMGFFESNTIFDGTKTYMIDPDSKTYSCEDGEESDNTEYKEMLIEENEAANVIGRGNAVIEGNEYSYEEFDANSENVRYYYDKDGNVKFVSTVTDEKEMIMVFEVQFLDAPDESVFTVPADYTEISSEEMAMKMIASMMGSIEDMEE